MIELIQEHGIPSVWINTQQKADCVFPDDLDASRSATETLLRLGHRRIAYADFGIGVGRPPHHYSNVDRYEGYARAMRAANLPSRYVQGAEFIPLRERAAFAAHILSGDDRPSAFVTYNDTTALPILHAAACRGLSIPRDLSVITFFQERLDRTGISVSTMVIPWHEVGSTAARMLLDKIADPSQTFPPRALQFALEEGATLAPVRV
ncbi:MAG TPA: LacI family DNA-binding transcriptional regulator [Planctomycetota bacterium]|nr:LacI family DNA-binding transcriptional regulator [Planctomycetota bacterium]